MQRPFFKELDDLYKEVLQRPVDPSGYQTYSGLLESGRKSIGDIAGILRCSDEYRRLCDADNTTICYGVPHRSPTAVAEAIKDVIHGRLVCDVGCAEGDNMVSLARHAARVIGLECDRLRHQQAIKRGFDAILADYWRDPFPAADVYYFFPTDGSADNEFLISKLLDDDSFQGKIVVAADGSIASELISIRRCARLGELRAVPYDEGTGVRERSVMLVAVIDAGEARARRMNRRKGERRVIATLGIGKDMEELMAVMLPGIEVYADVTGSDLCLISQPQIQASSVFYEVFQTARLFNYYDRILYIDLDVLVRAGAPDLFDIVPSDHVGVFFESRIQSVEEVEFFNNPVRPARVTEWTTGTSGRGPGLPPDSFNNGVTVLSRQHRFIMEPPVEYPDDAKCTDQTIMNSRVINSGVPVYDITEAFNYMVCMLDRNDEGYRQSAWMIHYGSLPMATKLETAVRDLARWTRGVSAPRFSPPINRVFRRLVPVAVQEGPGKAGRFDQPVELLMSCCDGTKTVSEIAEIVARAAGRARDEVEDDVIATVNALLHGKYLIAKNQYCVS